MFGVCLRLLGKTYDVNTVLPLAIMSTDATALDLPPLPTFPISPDYPEQAWSPSVYGAYFELRSVFDHAQRLLSQDSDPARLTIHAENVAGKCFPLLLAMEQYEVTEHIPHEWLEQVATALASLLNELSAARHAAQDK